MTATSKSPLKQPLKWRLADVDGSGVDLVNVVMPDLRNQSQQEIMLATDIPSPHKSTMDVGWSEEDSQLFVLLVEKMLDDSIALDSVDLTHPEVVDILHVVAAAHFIPPIDGDVVLADDVDTVLTEVDMGDLVAIHTQDGFKSAIISELDSIEAVCVLLEAVEINSVEDLDVYDTLVVNKHSLLPAEFGNVIPGDQAVIH